MSTEVVHADEGLVLAVRGPVVVGLWSGEPTYERQLIAFRAARDAERSLGRRVGVISVLTPGAPFPSVADFGRIARAAVEGLAPVLAIALVVEGYGARVERAVEVLTSIEAAREAIRPGAFRQKYATSVEEGAAWLAAQLRREGETEIDRDAIVEVVEHARARAR